MVLYFVCIKHYLTIVYEKKIETATSKKKIAIYNKHSRKHLNIQHCISDLNFTRHTLR